MYERSSREREIRFLNRAQPTNVVNCFQLYCFRFLSVRLSALINIYLVIPLLFHFAFDSFLGFEDALDRHVRVQATGALHLALIPLLGTLAFFLDCFPLHAHRQAFLVSAILASISLSFVDDARLLLAARVRQVLAYGPLEETLATLAATNKRKEESIIIIIRTQF